MQTAPHAAPLDTYFRSLLEATPDALVIVGTDGRVLLVNARTESLFGYAREELIGQPVDCLLPERFRKRHARHLARYRETERIFDYPRVELIGQPVELLIPERLRTAHLGHRASYDRAPRSRPMGLGIELLARRKDGSEFPVEISLLSPADQQDDPLTISIIRDMTERKRAEAKFRGLLEAAPDAMVISNPEGEILLVNSQTEKLFGGSREDLIGQPVETLIPERYPSCSPEWLRCVPDRS